MQSQLGQQSASRLLRFPQSVSQALPVEARSMAPVQNRTALTETDALLHDARNALASLYLLAGLLGEPGVLTEPNMQLADDLGQVTRMLGGILGSLGGAESVAGPIPVPPPPARARSAGEALRSCERLLRTAAGSSVAVYLSAENNLPALRLSDDDLGRVLTNLVKNAREAMPGGGAVHITARRALSRTNKAVLVHVSDNGPGIPSHALGSIFETGFSSKRGVPPNEPCGLGLAIVRELVQATGGEVRVASKRRRGTTFELRLPCITDGE